MPVQASLPDIAISHDEVQVSPDSPFQEEFVYMYMSADIVARPPTLLCFAVMPMLAIRRFGGLTTPMPVAPGISLFHH